MNHPGVDRLPLLWKTIECSREMPNYTYSRQHLASSVLIASDTELAAVSVLLQKSGCVQYWISTPALQCCLHEVVAFTIVVPSLPRRVGRCRFNIILSIIRFHYGGNTGAFPGKHRLRQCGKTLHGRRIARFMGLIGPAEPNRKEHGWDGCKKETRPPPRATDAAFEARRNRPTTAASKVRRSPIADRQPPSVDLQGPRL